MKATAVLLKYKRIEEIKLIVKELEKYPDLINEIIIWDNSAENMCGYGRYLGALKAKNDIIYTQDDDCIVKNIRELFSRFDNTIIVNNMTPHHIKKHRRANHTLPGWGMIFNKSWIKCLDKYIEIYGVDELFIRDTGRIFTGLYGEWESIVGKIKNLPSRKGKMALCKQAKHKSFKKLAVKRINVIRALKQAGGL